MKHKDTMLIRITYLGTHWSFWTVLWKIHYLIKRTTISVNGSEYCMILLQYLQIDTGCSSSFLFKYFVWNFGNKLPAFALKHRLWTPCIVICTKISLLHHISSLSLGDKNPQTDYGEHHYDSSIVLKWYSKKSNILGTLERKYKLFSFLLHFFLLSHTFFHFLTLFKNNWWNLKKDVIREVVHISSIV